jgi:hypothetical protein
MALRPGSMLAPRPHASMCCLTRVMCLCANAEGLVCGNFCDCCCLPHGSSGCTADYGVQLSHVAISMMRFACQLICQRELCTASMCCGMCCRLLRRAGVLRRRVHMTPTSHSVPSSQDSGSVCSKHRDPSERCAPEAAIRRQQGADRCCSKHYVLMV